MLELLVGIAIPIIVIVWLLRIGSSEEEIKQDQKELMDQAMKLWDKWKREKGV